MGRQLTTSTLITMTITTMITPLLTSQSSTTTYTTTSTTMSTTIHTVFMLIQSTTTTPVLPITQPTMPITHTPHLTKLSMSLVTMVQFICMKKFHMVMDMDSSSDVISTTKRIISSLKQKL